MMKVSVQANTSNGFEIWTVRAAEKAPWSIEAESPDGQSHKAVGGDLFDALRKVRLELEERGVTLCCNGGRINAHPSPQVSGEGAVLVYLIPKVRNPGMRDLVPLLAPAPPVSVVTVAAQDLYWRRTVSSPWAGVLRRFNPISAVWNFKHSRHRIDPWVSVVDGEGFVRWSRYGSDAD